MNDPVISPFLRRVLVADAVVCAAFGLLLVLAASLLADLMNLPGSLLRAVGIFLLPYSLLIAYVATRPNPPRAAVWTIIVFNALWAIDSIALLFTGWVAPNALGVAFIISQALLVAAFAEAQYLGLRQSMKTAHS